ncbi:hypothetical protein [uncultured Williamsia sp.]|uniref:hypothetical protein n=1 Tax=uncultured Williamsia sp. TaxID=259311 RepID=UPI00261C44E6|nr:hypothetical protein [uncultured Williamsia sp.]
MCRGHGCRRGGHRSVHVGCRGTGCKQRPSRHRRRGHDHVDVIVGAHPDLDHHLDGRRAVIDEARVEFWWWCVKYADGFRGLERTYPDHRDESRALGYVVDVVGSAACGADHKRPDLDHVVLCDHHCCVDDHLAAEDHLDCDHVIRGGGHYDHVACGGHLGTVDDLGTVDRDRNRHVHLDPR